MSEIDVLTSLRRDTRTMSTRAQIQGRLRLTGQITTQRSGTPRWLPTRRALLLTAVAALLSAAVFGYQIVGPPTAGGTAEAATVLNQAAAAVSVAPGPPPRPEQFMYLEVQHVTGGQTQRVQTWTAVDGSRPGLIRIQGFAGTSTHHVVRYDPADGLRTAPYTVLAKLPIDPALLLRILSDDPYVLDQRQHNSLSRAAAIWSLLREIVAMAPPPQKAALFKVASQINGIAHVKHATDAAGRAGEAVGLNQPGLGNVQFVFDTNTHTFLGERILNPGSATDVQFNTAVRRTAVVDTPGTSPRS